MSGLTRDRTAEPNSRDRTLRRERGQGKFHFFPDCSADHKQDWQPYPVDAQFAESDDHTHTHACLYLNRRITATMPTTAASAAEEEASQQAEGSRCMAQGRALLREMNPTPAVCGDPRDVTYAVIGDIEGFDR